MRVDVSLGASRISDGILRQAEKQYPTGLQMVVYNDAPDGQRMISYHYGDGLDHEAQELKGYFLRQGYNDVVCK